MDGLFIIKLLAIANRIDSKEGENICNELTNYFGLEIMEEVYNSIKIIKAIELK